MVEAHGNAAPEPAPHRLVWVARMATTVGVMVGVSCLTAEPSYDRISGLTFATVTDRERAESRASWGSRDVLGSVAVLLMILVAYLYFRG